MNTYFDASFIALDKIQVRKGISDVAFRIGMKRIYNLQKERIEDSPKFQIPETYGKRIRERIRVFPPLSEEEKYRRRKRRE